jgi:hypothetical protein
MIRRRRLGTQMIETISFLQSAELKFNLWFTTNTTEEKKFDAMALIQELASLSRRDGKVHLIHINN